MKKFSKFIALFFIFIVMVVTNITAQSTVYFFVRSFTSAEVKILKNGDEIFDLRGPVKKVIDPIASMKLPSISYSPAYRKCQFNDDGKVLFSVNFAFTNVGTTEIINLAAEIQLNLSEGSIHYVYLTGKGLNDIQLKELTEKEASKFLKDKKYVELEEYIEQ